MLTGSIVPCGGIRRRSLEGLLVPALTGRYRQSLGLPCRRRPPRWLGAAAPPRHLLRSLPAAPRPHRPATPTLVLAGWLGPWKRPLGPGRRRTRPAGGRGSSRAGRSGYFLNASLAFSPACFMSDFLWSFLP